MIDSIDLIISFSLVIFYLISDSYFLLSKNHNETKRANFRINYYIYFSAIFITCVSLLGIFLSAYTNLRLVMYFAFGLLVYVIMTEILYSEDKFRMRFRKRPASLFYLLLCIIVILTLSVVGYMQLASLFGSDDNWFSDTFMSFFNSTNIAATATFLFIGALVLIMGKARHQAGLQTIGKFLVIGMPIFDVLNTFFNVNLRTEIVNSPLYHVFENLAFCLIVYVIMQLLFYLLIVSIVLSFISMMDTSE